MTVRIEAFFDEPTNTVSYVAADPPTKVCAIIDPVLDYDPASGRISHASADKICAFIGKHGLTVEWILETHAHADHLSAAHDLKKMLGGKIGIGAHIADVQKIFSKVFNLGPGFATDGSQFDALFTDGSAFSLGAQTVKVMHTPGHTPACVTYIMGDAAFVGDTLFMPDYGTARADFPGGDARTLYRSIRKVLSLPPATRLFMCHDYLPAGRTAYAWETTVAAERQSNIHVKDGISEDDFAAMRAARDKTLGMPRLILPSIQVNIRAGALPPPESNGTAYLKIPVGRL
ncbi:MAG: MBL fold metallo-hydrolase [Rhodospirillaceae bacterium]|nr:MBL fold metallo-hydrolase [Rhodospirillaceae bacterium]